MSDLVYEENNRTPKLGRNKKNAHFSTKDTKHRFLGGDVTDSSAKLVAHSNWAFGLKNGFRNSNRLIWLDTNRSKSKRQNGDTNNNKVLNASTWKTTNVLIGEQAPTGQILQNLNNPKPVKIKNKATYKTADVQKLRTDARTTNTPKREYDDFESGNGN